MKWWAALVLALAAGNEGRAATAYVTDELVLGVYAQPNTAGQRLATLHSGAAVETLAVNGEATQIRLADGTVGWVKTAYLVSDAPATVRIKLLQDELDRRLATTPALAEAAERSEVARLTRQLDGSAGARDHDAGAHCEAWRWCLALLAALAAGFGLGHALLARRIRRRFGGMKVY